MKNRVFCSLATQFSMTCLTVGCGGARAGRACSPSGKVCIVSSDYTWGKARATVEWTMLFRVEMSKYTYKLAPLLINVPRFVYACKAHRI